MLKRVLEISATVGFIGGVAGYMAWQRAWETQAFKLRENAMYLNDQLFSAKCQRTLNKAKMDETVAKRQELIHTDSEKLLLKAERYQYDCMLANWGYDGRRRRCKVAKLAFDTFRCAVDFVETIDATKPGLVDAVSLAQWRKTALAGLNWSTNQGQWFKLRDMNRQIREVADAAYEAEHPA